ncbi:MULTISPECIES: hypothetical protein [unclassified Leucobacter]|uniref:hypothetical protein n=1 Tax=unclassified Leucobacter TaxID=2621730 RepID=UPI000621C2E0|nr:hypothetical protein [Leucobacter sp. Ag1]KKI18725.1 hypothetical protein XM48_10620 [Leucobacter sp. Ag1]
MTTPDAPQPETAATPAPAAPKKTKRNLILWGSAAAVVLIAAGVTIASVAAANQAEHDRVEQHKAALEKRKNEFPNAAKACDFTTFHYDTLDDGEAVEIDHAVMKYGEGLTATQVFCFLGELDAPASLEAKINNTRALDGTQTETWNHLKATWTYHPDSGLNLIVERTDDPPKLNK